MAKNKMLKILGGALLICLLFLGSAFGTSKLIEAKKFNNLVNSANQKFNTGNYDEAIALYNEALQIKNDTGVKNQLFLAQNCKIYQPNRDQANDKNNSADKKNDAASNYTEENIMDSFSEEEKRLLAQVSNININEPIVHSTRNTSSNNAGTNKSSSSKKYSNSTHKNVESSDKVYTSNTSSSDVNSSTNINSNTNSDDSNIKSKTDSNNNMSKQERIDALYQQEQKDLAPYIGRINELKQESSQLTLAADALPQDSANKAELLKRKADVEQEVMGQLEECRKIASGYLQKVESIEKE